MRLTARVPSDAWWSQSVRLKAKQYYRIEADVRAVCGDSDRGGVSLRVAFPGTSSSAALPVVRRTAEKLTLRGYIQPPAGAKLMDVQIGLCNAAGWAEIHEVRVVPVLEPDSRGHVLAAPPPPYAYPPPVRAQRIAVCCDTPAPSSLMALLTARFGSDAVAEIKSASSRNINALDAILFPSDAPPRGIRSLSALEKLARGRIVVISPRAFTKLTRGALKLRRINQPDDPLHATLRYAGFISRGLALSDVFPFSARGDSDDVFVQDQFYPKSAAWNFCARHKYQVLLEAVTARESSMDLPIALIKETPGGALIVCDLAPLETPPSTLREPNVAAMLLLNMLGCEQSILGEFVTPARSERQFRQHLVDFATHYEAITLSGLAGPSDPATAARIRLGREDVDFTGVRVAARIAGARVPSRTHPRGELLGLTRERPTVLIRTGLTPGDEDGIYGVMLWFKRLVRPMPHACTYANAINSRLRLEWLPLNRDWTALGLGFESMARRASSPSPPLPLSPSGPASPLRALVDVSMRRGPDARVVFANSTNLAERCACALPALARANGVQRFTLYAPGEGIGPGDWDHYQWRTIGSAPRVDVDRAAFAEPLHAAARSAGAELIRIETPRSAAGIANESVWRTDFVALTLDQIIGLLCGTIVANHSAHEQAFEAATLFGDACGAYELIRLAGDGITVEERSADRAQRLRLAPGDAARSLC